MSEYGDRFFINSEKTEIVKVEYDVEKDKHNVYLWDVKTNSDGKPLYHPNDYRETEAGIITFVSMEIVLEYLGKNFREYDPEVIDHNDEDNPFMLDMGEID